MYKRNYTKSGKKLERVYLWGGSYRGMRYWKGCDTGATPHRLTAELPSEGSLWVTRLSNGSP